VSGDCAFLPEIPACVPIFGASVLKLDLLPRLHKAALTLLLAHTRDGDDIQLEFEVIAGPLLHLRQAADQLWQADKAVVSSNTSYASSALPVAHSVSCDFRCQQADALAVS
jgi:hypothetical protein